MVSNRERNVEPDNAPPFIPGWLDDMRLTPAQFRVFCHIARRGNCFEALPITAEVCGMHRETVQTSINALLQLGLIEKEPRKGRTSVLRLREPSGKGGLGSPDNLAGNTATTQRERGANHLAVKGGYKGSPSEVTPNKGILFLKGKEKNLSRFSFSLEEAKAKAREIGMPQGNAEECWKHHCESNWTQSKETVEATLLWWKKGPGYKPKTEPPSEADHSKGFFA